MQSLLSDSTHKQLLRLKELIQEQDEFTLGTHIQPDGDAIGSLLGFYLLLQKMGKKVDLAGNGNSPIPPQYSFLPNIEVVKDAEKNTPLKPNNFIALDCATSSRLGKLLDFAKKAKTVINIDHHPENENFGDINLVDVDAPSCSELIFRLSEDLNQELNSRIATSLYVGLVTDTGRFQYSNTNRRAFDMADKLLKYQVSPNQVFQEVYESYSFEIMKLAGMMLAQAQLVSDLNLVYSTVTQNDLKETRARVEETENLIDSLRGIKKAKIAALFKETPNGHTKVSLRSKGDIDVEKVARRFGGGGHVNASGYEVENGLEQAIKDLIGVLKGVAPNET